MKKLSRVFLKVGASHGLAARTFNVERRGPQHDVLAIKRAVALADRHRRLPRVVPHRCEAIRFRVEAGDSGSRTFCSIRIEEREIRLQELAVLDQVLLAHRLGDDGLSIHREERLHDIPLAGELGEKGFTVVTHTTYRMVPASSLPREVCDAFVAHQVEAVLHYSRRSARAFLDAARSGGVEISALALPQCCISAAVASILRDAGATQVTAAVSADEIALFEALGRALRPRLA